MSFDVSFVFPCLNEERFIADCIRRVRQSLDADPTLKYEIVLADNGSTDRSREIAAECGARIVPIAERGYGSALRGGITAAQGKHVLFADADGTYLLEDALKLYRHTLEMDADMGSASRLNGKIEDGAMPFLHRYLGTPVITRIINLLFRGSLTDSNSGFRCVKHEKFLTWGVHATGMEFASELFIAALKHNAKIVEIQSGLKHPPFERHPHLRTWRDGMRNLLFIFSERPALFEWLGLILGIVCGLLQIVAMITGPIDLAGFNIFDLHSRALLLLMGLVGTQFYIFGCMCYLRSKDKPTGLSRLVIGMNEGVLFFSLTSILTVAVITVAYVFYIWARAGFAGLHFAPLLLSSVHLIGMLAILCIGILGIHVVKRYEIK